MIFQCHWCGIALYPTRLNSIFTTHLQDSGNCSFKLSTCEHLISIAIDGRYLCQTMLSIFIFIINLIVSIYSIWHCVLHISRRTVLFYLINNSDLVCYDFKRCICLKFGYLFWIVNYQCRI